MVSGGRGEGVVGAGGVAVAGAAVSAWAPRAEGRVRAQGPQNKECCPNFTENENRKGKIHTRCRNLADGLDKYMAETVAAPVPGQLVQRRHPCLVTVAFDIDLQNTIFESLRHFTMHGKGQMKISTEKKMFDEKRVEGKPEICLQLLQPSRCWERRNFPSPLFHPMLLGVRVGEGRRKKTVCQKDCKK